MEALVLGGTRFVGLHLVQRLNRSGHSVTILNRGSTKAIIPNTVSLIRADRSDPDSVTSALKQHHFDTVFDISGYLPGEVETTLRALHDRIQHYVFCSSVAVYATSDIAPIREDAPLDHGPSGDYGRDKILCEDRLLEWSDKQGVCVTIIRPPYVYGPGDRISRRLFSIFARLYQKRNVIVPGNGTALNHSVHVEDLASAFTAVSGQRATFGQTYNVAGPQAITLKAYVELIASVMGTHAQIVEVSVEEYKAMVKEVPGINTTEISDFSWIESQVYSTDKLQRDICWSPKYGIEQGLLMTYEWWLNQGFNKALEPFPSDDLALAWLSSHKPK